MSLNIKQHNEAWRIEFENEVWECSSEKELHSLLSTLLALKKKYVPKARKE